MRRTILILLALTLLPAFGAGAAVEAEVQRTLGLESAPLDLAVTPDGKRTFVLLQGGEVLVYSVTGELEGRLRVSADANRIGVAGGGDQLLVGSGKSKSLQVVAVHFIQEIPIAGAPLQGPSDAPNTVVVFSDFQ